MYESQTIDVILARLMSNIDDKYEKTPGNLAYDLCKAYAIDENALYQALDNIINMLDVDNLTGDQLAKYVYQRKGITRKVGGYSSTILDIAGNGNISIGDLFSTSNNVQFSATENVTISGTGQVHVICTQMGAIGNVPANTITEMPVTIPGITSVTNTEAINNGYDEESDSDLRERYKSVLQEPPTSGNRYHYKMWAEKYTGVGKSFVLPLWDGDNTVKVVIINSNKQAPDQSLIDGVQQYIDPKGVQDEDGNWSMWGAGYGEAPIGAYCTIAPPIVKTIDVAVSINKDSNYTDTEVEQNIKDGINNYFASIALDKENAYVSYSKINNIILTAQGVLDCSALTINDSIVNVLIGFTKTDCEIPALGAVTIAYV